MTLFEHILQGKEITRLACSKNTQPLIQPDTIVIHATGGSSVESSARYLANKATPVSAHLVIGTPRDRQARGDIPTRAVQRDRLARREKRTQRSHQPEPLFYRDRIG